MPMYTQGLGSVEGSSTRTPVDKPREAVGVEHICALGDASASLGLIATLVFSVAVDILFNSTIEATVPSTIEIFCVAGACACGAFVLSFALLEFYYAQMLKKTDDTLKMQEEEAVAESSSIVVHVKRVTIRKAAEKAVKLLNPLRARSRNAMWLSLVLLMFGGVAHVFTGVEDVYGIIAGVVLVVLVLLSCLTIVNNVQQFRNMYSGSTSSTPALWWWPKAGHIDAPTGPVHV